MLANTKDVNSGNEMKPMVEIGGDVRQQAATDTLPNAGSSRESS
jgi:hypothetical protein